MSAFPDVIIGNKEYGIPVKTGAIVGDERLPIAFIAGVAASELDLRALIGNSPGAFIEFEVRDAGPLYVGMNKAATSATSLTAGTASLGRQITLTPGLNRAIFWVSRDLPFCEVISDAATTHILYRRVNPNRWLRDNVMATGH